MSAADYSLTNEVFTQDVSDESAAGASSASKSRLSIHEIDAKIAQLDPAGAMPSFSC